MTQSFSANFDNYKKTWSVQTELPISFTVQYSSDVFNPKNHDLLNCGSNNSNRRIIVIDRNVYKLYSNQLVSYFEQLKVDGKVLIIDSDEENKTWDNANKILQFFETEGLLRREPVIAIGGGVLLDIVGYCASIYRRGVPYIKVPTTLLAIVDASVGAKVAVNHFDRRNRIGAYYPAIATLIDKRFIATQSEREIVNGIAEILKLAIIKDAELFELLETNYETLINEKFLFGAVPVRVINLAITGMIEELAPNLWEKKLDRCVDFGHTFSPIIEMQNIPNLLHGEAVILDCLFSSCIAYNRTYLSAKDLDRIFTTTKNLKLPIFQEDFTKIELLLKSLSDTMKHRNGNQYLPLPLGIGNYKIINDLTNDEIQKAINTFSQYKE